MEFYLPEDTKYLTNHGLKRLNDIDKEEDGIAVIDKYGRIIYTKDYLVKTKRFDTMMCQHDKCYQQLVSDIPIEFEDYVDIGTFLKDSKLIDSVKINLDDKIYENISLDFVLASALAISNAFKVNDKDEIISENNRHAYRILSSIIENYQDLYFSYNRLSKCYCFKSTSLYKSPEKLEQLLVDNISIFKNVLVCLKDIHFSNYKGVNFADFKTFKVANIFSVLLSLSGYKSYVKFNKQNKTFKVSFTSRKDSLEHSWYLEKENIFYKEPIEAHSILFNAPYKIIVSQNINHITSSSIIKASYNYLEGDEDGFE